VTYRSPTIDTRLRTFEIKAAVPGDDEKGIVPGAMVELALILSAKEATAVPTPCVIHRLGKTFVFVVKDGTAIQQEVKTGLQHEGYTEIVGEALSAGVQVAVEGQALLSDGAAVKIQE
jgi:multidrug efflux pump subunit AcrA (membrane-fusion protein)